jgi:hypothetical protein
LGLRPPGGEPRGYGGCSSRRRPARPVPGFKSVTHAAQREGGSFSDPAARRMRAANSWCPTRSTSAGRLAVELVLYPYPVRVIPWRVLGSLLLLALLSWGFLSRFRRAPFLAEGWLWFLGMLVPVIGLVQVGSQALADRYTYLPLVGLFRPPPGERPGRFPTGRVARRCSGRAPSRWWSSCPRRRGGRSLVEDASLSAAPCPSPPEPADRVQPREHPAGRTGRGRNPFSPGLSHPPGYAAASNSTVLWRQGRLGKIVFSTARRCEVIPTCHPRIWRSLTRLGRTKRPAPPRRGSKAAWIQVTTQRLGGGICAWRRASNTNALR